MPPRQRTQFTRTKIVHAPGVPYCTVHNYAPHPIPVQEISPTYNPSLFHSLIQSGPHAAQPAMTANTEMGGQSQVLSDPDPAAVTTGKAQTEAENERYQPGLKIGYGFGEP